MSKRNAKDARAGRAPTQRQLRVGEEIRHALAEILRRADFRDPDLQDLNVTVSEVKVSPDLKNATAFIMPLGGGHSEQAAALTRASAYLRGQIAKAVRLPHVPRISFQIDNSFDYAFRIGQILHQDDVRRDLAGPGALPHDAAEADDGDDAGDTATERDHDGP